MKSAIAALILGVAPPSPDGHPTIVLEWSAPQACPDGDEIRSRIAALVTGEPPAAATVHVAGHITPGQNARWRLDLMIHTDGGSTTRSVEDEECEALADAAALVISVAIDPRPDPDAARSDLPQEDSDLPEHAQGRVPNEPPVPEPAPPEPVFVAPAPAPQVRLDPVPTTAPTRARKAPRRRMLRPPRFAFHAAGSVDSTPLPAAAWGIGGAAALFGRYWRAELGGTYSFGREATLTNTGASGVIALWALSAAGYGVPTAGPVEFPVGAGLEAGALEGRGTGATVDQQRESQPWVAALLGAGAVWCPWKMFCLGAAAHGIVPLIRPGFRIGNELLHRVDAIGVRGQFFLEVRSP